MSNIHTSITGAGVTVTESGLGSAHKNQAEKHGEEFVTNPGIDLTNPKWLSRLGLKKSTRELACYLLTQMRAGKNISITTNGTGAWVLLLALSMLPQGLVDNHLKSLVIIQPWYTIEHLPIAKWGWARWLFSITGILFPTKSERGTKWVYMSPKLVQDFLSARCSLTYKDEKGNDVVKPKFTNIVGRNAHFFTHAKSPNLYLEDEVAAKSNRKNATIRNPKKGEPMVSEVELEKILFG